METAKLLASIGANSTVVAAGLLHDTLDDSFLSHDHIFSTFGAGVADLVEGVSKRRGVHLQLISIICRHFNVKIIHLAEFNNYHLSLVVGDRIIDHFSNFIFFALPSTI